MAIEAGGVIVCRPPRPLLLSVTTELSYLSRLLLPLAKDRSRDANSSPEPFKRAAIVAKARFRRGDEPKRLVGPRSELPADRVVAGGELRRSRRPKPGGQRVRKPVVSAVSYPCDVAIRADQHGGGGTDHAEHRKLPNAPGARVGQLGPVGPWGGVGVARVAQGGQE